MNIPHYTGVKWQTKAKTKSDLHFFCTRLEKPVWLLTPSSHLNAFIEAPGAFNYLADSKACLQGIDEVGWYSGS